MADGDENKEGSPFATFLDEMKEAVQRGHELLIHQARVGKLQLELLQLKRDRRKLFERMGEAVYQLLQDGKIPVQVEIERPFEVLQKLEEQIAVLEEEIGQL